MNRTAMTVVGIVCLMLGMSFVLTRADETHKDLAQNKPATASTTESDEHAAASANDGDGDTRWCATDGTSPQWWQVDLGEAKDLSGAQIKWEMDEQLYLYMIEGSVDGKTWTTLSDQTSDKTPKTQVQDVKFDATGIRYVRIRITGGIDDQHWASIFDVKVWGKDDASSQPATQPATMPAM
jgi:F5/8 type C domain